MRYSRSFLGMFAACVMLLLSSMLIIPSVHAAPSRHTNYSIRQVPTSAYSLQLPWPTGQQHNINGGYTYGCGDHIGRDYYAIDFNLPANSQVSAIMAGTAHPVYGKTGYGNYIWILHPGNLVSLYGHLNSFAVADGTSVSQGQLIGLSGSTGNSTGPHLHFTLHSNATNQWNGTAYMPEPMSGYIGFGNYGYCTGRVSPMYTSTSPTPPSPTPPQPFNPRYVINLYHDVLSRMGSSSDVQTWVNALNQGSSRSQVAASFLASPEYRTNLVAADYQQMLHRSADSSGSAYFVGQLNNGVKNENVLVGLAASNEYFTNRGGGTNSSYVNALYQDMLQRAADPSGLAYWTQQLTNGVSRATVAQGLVTSTEYRTKLVDGYYLHYLGRNADPSGESYFISILNNGGTDESVIVGLVASDEYYAKQQAS